MGSAPSTSAARWGNAESCRGAALAAESRRGRSEARAARSESGAACNGPSPKAQRMGISRGCSPFVRKRFSVAPRTAWHASGQAPAAARRPMPARARPGQQSCPPASVKLRAG